MSVRHNEDYLVKTLKENWRREMRAAQLYQSAADVERDDRRRGILSQLADVEQKHARLWEDKMTDLDVDLDALRASESPSQKTSKNGTDQSQSKLLEQIEAVETGNATWYQSLRNVFDDPDISRILDEIDEDEADHESAAGELANRAPGAARKLLHGMWGRERWHKGESSNWVGDAVYGVNDGLGAIFGIIAGVAGFTANDSTVLTSGMFGALASTLSMGAGAWLATKSENELIESELMHERREIKEDPEHETEELGLLYELKGFSTSEAQTISQRISADPEKMLTTMASEELGIHETSTASPWRSAMFGSLSTLVGGIIPLIPFFFMHGIAAMVAAALISILAHFAVGAAKSLITVRSWWASGFEMTLVGIIVGVVSYGIGVFGASIGHMHL